MSFSEEEILTGLAVLILVFVMLGILLYAAAT